MKWTYNDYVNWINDGKPLNPHVIKLNVSTHKIKKFVDLDNLPNLTVLNCKYCSLDTLKGIENLKKLEKINCSSNSIKSLKYINNLENLKEINFANNQITVLLDYLNNLKKLNIINLNCNQLTSINFASGFDFLSDLSFSGNKILSLDGISMLTSLEILNCSNNKIQFINSISNLLNLKSLDCSGNKINSYHTLEYLKFLINLKYLNISHNEIKSIPSLRNLELLQKFICSNNHLINFPFMSKYNNLNLNYLDCSNNNIDSIDGLFVPANLTILKCMNNKISRFYNKNEMLDNHMFIFSHGNTININNILETVREERERRRRERRRRLIPIEEQTMYKNIYDDTENTHDSTIQKSIKKSILNIINDLNGVFTIGNVVEYIDNDTIFTSSTKSLLKYYLSNNYYCYYLVDKSIDVGTIIMHILNRIEKYFCEETKNEIKKIMNDEILRGQDLCMTGQLSRIVGSLAGFDPLVNMEISEKDQILNIIIATTPKDKNYSAESHKNQAILELLNRGYSEEKFKHFIDCIC